MQLQPCLVVTKPLARQARPVEGKFAFLDVLLGSATLIVEGSIRVLYANTRALDKHA